jgi:streptomycin 6-kinase
MFDDYLVRWALSPDGDPIITPRAYLLPVRRDGQAAMLKVATEAEEMFGGLLMTWWDGRGAARVLATDGPALLMERAEGPRSLADYARHGRDDEATHTLCDVIAELHAPRDKPLPDLVPLTVWFEALEPGAAAHGGILRRSAEVARSLLADRTDIRPLHGDVHHDNVLDFGERGWLVIDPKRIIGERGFDYANIFSNPDMGGGSPAVATRPDRFARRLEIVVERSGIERTRLLQWILAYSGLSAAWCLGDNQSAAVDLCIASFAAAALDA